MGRKDVGGWGERMLGDGEKGCWVMGRKDDGGWGERMMEDGEKGWGMGRKDGDEQKGWV